MNKDTNSWGSFQQERKRRISQWEQHGNYFNHEMTVGHIFLIKKPAKNNQSAKSNY